MCFLHTLSYILGEASVANIPDKKRYNYNPQPTPLHQPALRSTVVVSDSGRLRVRLGRCGDRVARAYTPLAGDVRRCDTDKTQLAIGRARTPPEPADWPHAPRTRPHWLSTEPRRPLLTLGQNLFAVTTLVTRKEIMNFTRSALILF